MRKKRKKTTFRPAPILWGLLVVNCYAGLNFSKMTSITKARAAGVPLYDRDRIEDILMQVPNIPCARIDSKKIESEVMLLPEVDQAELTRNVFGNALLKVRYRTPVARLVGRDHVVLSVDGILYRASQVPTDLPWIHLSSGGPPTLVAMAGNWQPASLAALAVYSRQNYPGRTIRIEVNERGVVCLNIDSGRVILGSCDDLDLKLKTLEARLQKNPQELASEQELNLTLPSAPTVVPIKPGKKQ